MALKKKLFSKQKELHRKLIELWTRGQSGYCEVRGSEIHGRGVYATDWIAQGTKIIEYVGELIDKQESDRRGSLLQDQSKETGGPAVYIFTLSRKYDIDGDVLIHFSVLREHGRRSVPEGAVLECVPVRLKRGLQAKKVLSIDLSTALPALPRSAIPASDRADRNALADAAGEFEPVEVKWFNRVRGYGFVKRPGEDGQDVFVHMETVRDAHLPDLQPGQWLEARVAPSGKGLTAVEVRNSDDLLE